MSLTIRTKLFAASALVCFGLAGLVLFVVWRLNASMALTARMAEVRAPMSHYGAEVLDGLSSSVSSLRAYMQQPDEKYKTERRRLWEAVIGPSLESMKSLAHESATGRDSLRLAAIETAGAGLRRAEEEIEAICHRPENRPAENLVTEQAIPHAAAMVDALNDMIADELRADDLSLRKPLLRQLVDARSHVGDCVANLRMYLAAAEAKYRAAGEASLAGVAGAFNRMKRDRSLLSSAQRAAFDRFSVAMHGFHTIPDRVFQIRNENRWNVAIHRMETEVSPLLAGLQDSVSAIVDDHQALMHGESRDLRASAGSLMTLLWMFLACGAGCSVIVALSMVRSIVLPLHAVADGAAALAAGNLENELPINGSEEFARISTSFNVLLSILRDKADVAARIAAGDLSANVRLASHADRLGQNMALMIEALRDMRQSISPLVAGRGANGAQAAVSRAVQDTLNTMRASMRDAATVLEQVASGNFGARFEQQEHSEFVVIKEVLNEAVGILDVEFSRIAARTARVAECSQDIHGSTAALAESAAQHVETAAGASTALDRFAAGFTDDDAKMEDARLTVDGLKSYAARQSEQLERLTGGLNQLKAGVEDSARIFKTVKDLAMHAKILSVNAAIEAAHAGEAGRSFAVVAGHLGDLARQGAATADASESVVAASRQSLETGCKIGDELIQQSSEAGARIQQANVMLAELAGVAQTRKQDLVFLQTSLGEVRGSASRVATEAEALTGGTAAMREAAADLQCDFRKFRFTIVEENELVFSSSQIVAVNGIASLPAVQPDVVDPHFGDLEKEPEPRWRKASRFLLDDAPQSRYDRIRRQVFGSTAGDSEHPSHQPENVSLQQEDQPRSLMAESDEAANSTCH